MGASYVPAAADLAASLRVVVTATNSYGQASASSAAFGPIASYAPVNTAPPTVSGTATRGLTLSVGNGSWTPAATSYSYQWQRSSNKGGSWTSISAATGSTYTLASADLSDEVRAAVTAYNPYGQTTADSAATKAVAKSPPVSTAAPAISGTAKVGSVLSASTGSWAGAGNSYAYQWQRHAGSGYVDIAGATAQHYTAQPADQGLAVRVIITAMNPDGSASDATSPTAPVAGAQAESRRLR